MKAASPSRHEINMTPKIINGICQHIDAEQAASILWISASSADIPPELPCTHCRPDEAELARLACLKFDYAILADLPGTLDKTSSEAVIANMRDIKAQKVFWVIDSHSPWESKDAIALGFHQLQQDDGATLYGYDIDNYKTTPDWLNARHWANPERWNKDRW